MDFSKSNSRKRRRSEDSEIDIMKVSALLFTLISSVVLALGWVRLLEMQWFKFLLTLAQLILGFLHSGRPSSLACLGVSSASAGNDFLKRFPLESTASQPRSLLVLCPYLFRCRQRTLLKVEATAAAREMLLPQWRAILCFERSGRPRRGKSDSTPDPQVPPLLWIEQTTLR